MHIQFPFRSCPLLLPAPTTSAGDLWMCWLGWGKEDVASFLCNRGWGACLPACLSTRPAAIYPVLEELLNDLTLESPGGGALWGIRMGLHSCWSLFKVLQHGDFWAPLSWNHRAKRAIRGHMRSFHLILQMGKLSPKEYFKSCKKSVTELR